MSSEQRNTLETRWNSISDYYSNYNECISKKDYYNENWDKSLFRTDCYKDTNNKYRYIICTSIENCNLNWTNIYTNSQTVYGSNNNISTQVITSNIANKDKLDKFISKVSSMKETMTPEKFKTTLDSFVWILNKAKEKYSTNATIQNMIVYLNDWIKWLYEESDIDNFFCELTDTCDKNELTNYNLSTNNNNNSNTWTNIVNVIFNWWVECWIHQEMIIKF